MKRWQEWIPLTGTNNQLQGALAQRKTEIDKLKAR
jgi:hypothetical protein